MAAEGGVLRQVNVGGIVGICDADSVYDPVDKTFRKKGAFDNGRPP